MLWTVRVSLPMNRAVDCSSIGGVVGVRIGEYFIDLWMRVMRPPSVFVAQS